MKKLFLILLASTYLFSSQKFVLHNDDTLLPKTEQKIEEMTNELYAKTGVALYVSAIAKLDADQTITTYTNNLASTLNGSYALIAISRLDRQIEMAVSTDLQKTIDKEEVMKGYIIPLLVEMRKDLSVQSQISAGILNGVAHMQDTVAKERGVEMMTSIGSESKNFYDGLMWVIKALALMTLIAFFLVWKRSR